MDLTDIAPALVTRALYDEAVSWAVTRIGVASSSPCMDAELLLAHVVNRPRASVLARGTHVLDPAELVRFVELVNRRAAGEPVAYLRGHVDWWDLTLAVSPAVLVPRPDTEGLLERALSLLPATGDVSVADIGTGSGNIAIALARHRPDVSVIAVETSLDALAVAAENVSRYGLQNLVHLRQGNLLAPVDQEPMVIVANLPYLSTAMMDALSADVRTEPTLALFGGLDGLDLYRELFQQYRARGWRCPVVCEIDPRQSLHMIELVERTLPGAHTRVWPDLAGRERVVEVHS